MCPGFKPAAGFVSKEIVFLNPLQATFHPAQKKEKPDS